MIYKDGATSQSWNKSQFHELFRFDRILLFGTQNKSDNHAIMNYQYYLIRRLFVRPGGQEQLNDFCMSLISSPQERRPSVLKDRERK